MTTINIRIEDKTKAEAVKTLAGIGLDMSSAIKLFLQQTINEKGLPFIPSKNPVVIRAKWDRQTKEALKGIGAKTARDLHRSITK